MLLKARGEPRFLFCVGDCDTAPDVFLLFYRTIHPGRNYDLNGYTYLEDNLGILDDQARYITKEEYEFFIRKQRE